MERLKQRRAFHTLDGLRGVAALLIIPRHVGTLSTGTSFPESFLAVDLFFLLSGFVIAYAYDNRLARPGFVLSFLGIRLIRLYPLYLLGLAVGAIYRSGSVLNGTEGWTAMELGKALLAGVLLVPNTPLTGIGSSALDGPTWTLFPELVANMAYALFFRRMRPMVLAAIVTCGAAGLIACRLSYGTLDAGWTFAQWPIIASRLAFSFFGGTLLFRWLGDRRVIRPLAAWLCLGLVAVALTVTPPEAVRAGYELLLVLIVFPFVLIIGCRNEPGPASRRWFHFLGLVSYAVYVLHQPAGALFGRLLQRGTHLDFDNPAAAQIGLTVFTVALLFASWAINRWFDMPVRRWLTRNWARRVSPVK